MSGTDVIDYRSSEQMEGMKGLNQRDDIVWEPRRRVVNFRMTFVAAMSPFSREPLGGEP